MEGNTTRKRKKKERQCQLCPACYASTKSLMLHYSSKHGLGKDDNVVKSTPKSPRKPCTRCGKLVSNPWAHKHSCPARRTAGEATTSAEPSPIKVPKLSMPGSTPSAPSSPPTPRLSDDQFVASYRAWMESANGNYAVEKTVKDYTRHVVRYIAAQAKEKPGFRARHWTRFGSSSFVPLADAADWVPRGTHSATAGQMISAYKHLLGLIRSALVKAGGTTPDFAGRLAHLNECHWRASGLARNFRKGKYAKASGEDRKAPSTVDTRAWKKVIKAYRHSPAREEALQLFSGVYLFSFFCKHERTSNQHVIFLHRQHLAVLGPQVADQS